MQYNMSITRVTPGLESPAERVERGRGEPLV